MADTMEMADIIEISGTPTDGIKRNKIGGPLLGQGLVPATSAQAIRSDPRILAHYREHTLKMIQELASIAYDLNNAPGVRLAAISEYLTRAMGKPVQAVDLNLTDNRPIVIDGALSKLAEIAIPVDNVDKSG